MKREIDVRVDLNVKSYDEILLKQLDTTQLIFDIYQDNKKVELADLSANIIFLKPNGTVVIQEATVDSSENIVVADLKIDCVRSYGRGRIEVELKKDTEVISTFQVDVKIEKTAKDDVKSDDSPNYIEEVENELNDLREKVANR